MDKVWAMIESEKLKMIQGLSLNSLMNENTAKNILMAGAREGILLLVEIWTSWRTLSYHMKENFSRRKK